MKRLLVLVWMTILLTGCKPTDVPDGLATPTHLVQEGDLLRWDAVVDATYYTIDIDGVEVRTNEPQYSLLDLRNGTYTVRVQANRMGLHSDFSAAFDLVIDRTYDHPRALRLEDGALYWDIETTPDSYEVRVNGVTDTTTIVGRTLILEPDTFYHIEVRALYPGGESSWSTPLLHHTYTEAHGAMDLTVNRLLPRDIVVDYVSPNPVAVFRNDDGFLADTVVVASDPLTFDIGWIALLPLGTHTIDVIDDNGRYHITLTLIEDDRPVLLDSNTVSFTGEDLTFTFALFGGSIADITGQGITDDDYIINGSELVIQASFVQAIVDADPDRETIVLSYQLVQDDDITLGYLFLEISTD